jgi:hypothetical protein
MKPALSFFSFLTHPLLQGFFLIYILFFASPSGYYYYLTPGELKTKFFSFAFLFLFFLPLLSSWTGIRLIFNKKSFFIFSKHERIIYYLVFILFFFTFWFTIKDIIFLRHISFLVFSGIIFLSLGAVALPSLKVSVHAGGNAILLIFVIWGWAGHLLVEDLVVLYYFIISGLAGSVRIFSGDHTLPEVVWGYITGFMSYISAWWILS